MNTKARQLEALRQLRKKAELAEEDFHPNAEDFQVVDRVHSRIEKFNAVVGMAAGVTNSVCSIVTLVHAWRTNSLMLALCGLLVGCCAVANWKRNLDNLCKAFG